MDAGSPFGALLRRYREAAGLTQEELAERARLSREAVSTLERGLRRSPHPETVRLLAEALRLSQEEMAALAAALPRRRGRLPAAVRAAPPSSPAVAAPPAAVAPALPPPEVVPPAAASAAPGLPVEGENRVLTVLCVELAAPRGRSLPADPEDRADLLAGALPVVCEAIAAHAGHVHRLLGETVFAYFGAPRAHERHPEHAVRAALAIRSALRPHGLDVSAGIATGAAYLGPVGAAPDRPGQELAVVGAPADLALRLREVAEPGQMLVAPATHAQARRAVAFAPLEVAPRGYAGPLGVYRVIGPLPHPGGARGVERLPAALVGRDHELALLQQALASVLDGRGGLVSLIGEAGLGKSRLIGELQDMARAALRRPSPLWLEGRCLETGLAVSYWPFLDLLQTYLGWGPHTAEDVRGQTLAAALAGLVRAGVLAADRADEMLPVLGHLLSLERGGERGAPLAAAHPEAIKHQTFLALRDLVLALARRAPLILVLEDLHWADGLSLDLLSLLMETVALAPLLLVCAYRPEQGHRCRHLAAVADRKCPGGYTEVRLRDLSPEHSRRLVESLLHGEALPPPLKEQILTRAQGNPFFLEEIVRSLVDAGLVYHDGAAWRAREKIAAVAVPESVQSVIVSRVDRLDPAVKGLLQVAAVIGRLVPRRLLVEVLAASAPASPPAERMDVERLLWELEDRRLLYQERVIPEEEYSFQHVLTQETVYGGILRRRRAALHGSVAGAIERLHGESLDEYHEQLAHHYDRAGLPNRAVDYLLKAGEKSRRAYLNDEALAYFQRSLDLLAGTSLGGDRPDWQLAALKGLGQVERALGREPEAEAHLRRAIELGQSLGRGPRDLVPLYWWLGEGLWFQGRFDEVRRLGEEGQALLGAETASFEAALINALLGAAYLVDPPHHADFGAAAARNAAFIETVPYSEDLRSAYVQLIMAQGMEKNPEMAMTWVRRFEAVAHRHHDVLALGDAYYQESGVLSNMGDLQGALAPMQRSIALHRDRDTIHESLALIDAAAVYLAQGELDAAEEHLRRGVAQWPGERAEWQRADAIGKLGVVALCRGAVDAARAYFEEADGIFAERPNTTTTLERANMALLMARASLAQGSREDALRHAAAAIVLRQTVLEEDLHIVDAVLGAPSETRAWLERLCRDHPEVAVPAGVVWFPPATECARFLHQDVRGAGVEFGAALEPAWDWHDPLGGSSYSLGGGLEIRAAAGRDLQRVNVSAPRLLRPAPRGDFALQAVCAPVPDGRPAIGGLLLWEGRGQYLVLERGRWGARSVSFRGLCEGWDHQWDRDRLIGRGYSPTDSVWLRLERRGDLVRALYSGDGTAWLSAGEVEFPAGEGAQTGLYAAGSINRAVYPGAYRDGAALRFEAFHQWTAGSG